MTQAKLPVAIGDIHGRLDLLDHLLERFPNRQLVFLGDLIDRGPESRGVVHRVRKLVEEGEAICCMGNHDQMMVQVMLEDADRQLWDVNGGDTTRASYNGDTNLMIADALWMRDSMLPWYVEEHILFSHAMRPHPRDEDAHLWGRPTDTPFYPLPESITVSVHGHTAMQACPLMFPLADDTCAWFIDTGAVFSGRLCALDLETQEPTIIEALFPVAHV